MMYVASTAEQRWTTGSGSPCFARDGEGEDPVHVLARGPADVALLDLVVLDVVRVRRRGLLRGVDGARVAFGAQRDALNDVPAGDLAHRELERVLGLRVLGVGGVRRDRRDDARHVDPDPHYSLRENTRRIKKFF